MCCLLFVVSLFVVHCWLFVVDCVMCWVLFTVYCCLFVCLLL